MICLTQLLTAGNLTGVCFLVKDKVRVRVRGRFWLQYSFWLRLMITDCLHYKPYI